MSRRPIVPALVLAGILALAHLSDSPAEPAALDVPLSGDPAAWDASHTKALDPVYDADVRGDLMGFAYDQGAGALGFRVHLYRPPMEPDRPTPAPGVRVFVLMDYRDGGTTALPAGLTGTSAVEWDRAFEVVDPATVVLHAPDAAKRSDGSAREVHAPRRWPNVEWSVDLPPGFREATAFALGKRAASDADLARAAADDATPARFHVLTVADGVVLDELLATHRKSDAHNVAFVQHLNQGLTYTTVFRGERGENAAHDGDTASPDDGADELLAAHDYYNQPLNFHNGGLLISAAEWHDPGFNDWLSAGVQAGRYEILTSALGQHIMPFVRDEINGKAVAVENDMIQTLYGYTPRVAWVPERVWVENPDDDGNGIESSAGVIDTIQDDFLDNGIWAVILDDYVHAGYANGPFDDHHIYTYNGIKVLPIDNDFVGEVNHDAGAAWNTILAGTSDEIILYGNDAEIAAEVSQGADNPSALNNYIWLLQQCANDASVGVWKLTDVLQDPGFTTQPVDLQNGTYGLLGEFGGYGGSNNSWYTDWASYTGPSNLDGHDPKWNYGQQWDHTLNKILAAPANAISEMAWYVLLTNLHETGWHDDGEISGWQHHYSNHIRSANAHAEAARWAGGLYVDPTGAYTADHDDDGVEELVLYNDRLMAVFDTIGGKLQWLFAKGVDYGYSVVSNDNVYWADSDGDYNETNHVAALSDASVAGQDRQAELYGLFVDVPSGGTVQGRLVHPSVTKTVSLTLGDPYLKVEYRTAGERAYVKNGFTPDNLDLTWSGRALERIWDPDGGGYFGQRDTNSSATAAIVVGSAGAVHNTQFSATLLEGDEFYGDGPFEVYVYGGYTSPLDGMGHVPELKALRDVLVDQLAPVPLGGIYYPTTRQLTVWFDEAVDPGSVGVTGFSLDTDDDGVADVTLTAGDVLLTATTNRKLDFSLTPATGSAIEGLAGPLELLLAASSVADAAANGNPEVTHTDDVPVTVAPPTTVQIDGLVTDADWLDPRKREDDFWDSAWNGTAPGDTNEINVMLVDWDDTYLYLGLRGYVAGNSWILYLDTDFGGPNGETDLTAIDAWERGATFASPGFAADFQYAAYQHQSAFDAQGFFRIDSATTTTDLGGQVTMAFDPDHLNGYEGGSELAIPWDVLYGLGPGVVPAGATLAVVASVCYDPEPNGELGGDSVPNNLTATLPTLDNACTFDVDTDLDGQPDPKGPVAVPDAAVRTQLFGAYPNPTRGRSATPLVIAGRPGGSSRVQATVYDLAGRRVRDLVDRPFPPGRHLLDWDGRDNAGRDTGAGVYFLRVRVDGEDLGARKVTRVR